jgi:3D (Asp-Asp-Asp) domain-containing protein
LRALLPLAGAACLCLVLLTPASGTGPSTKIAALRADDAGLATESRAAVLELYSLDERLSAARERLLRLQQAQRELIAQRLTLRRELLLARVDSRLSQNRLASRLRFLYEHGTTSSLDVVLGAKSLDDALEELDAYNRVAAANASVLGQVQASHRHLVRLGRTIGAREQALAATTSAAARIVAELQQLRSSRVSYLDELASRRSLDASRIASLEAEANAAVVRSDTLVAPQLVAAPQPAEIPSTSPGPAGSMLTVTATGYDLPGHTSTGLPVGWGIAAVDPSVIPLGTRIVVPGYGVAVAADTGGAIQGATIDLWFPTAAQAYAWGRRTITIAVEQS